ncbi:MAG: FAD:protein FMN transferase [Pyramidobacter sp.]|nr:FAD:protein FMN transferase [Pyramidobacter sp.]
MKKTVFVALALLAPVLLFAWRRSVNSMRHELSFFAMDTPVTLTAYGPAAPRALRNAETAVRALERELSVTLPQSAVARLNAGESLPVSSAAGRAVSTALKLHDETDGTFDPTLYPVLREWGFTTGKYRVPPREELAEQLKLCGVQHVFCAHETLRLDASAMIDLGGIGKGMASDAAAQALKDAGIASAVLNLGGNVRTLGKRPDGCAWRIGVRAPEGGLLGVIETGEGAVVTSGSYERFFEKDGVRYWHILDPKTGEPARSGAVSVTVVGSSGTRCDALSTAYFVMGAEQAAAFWKARGTESFVMLTDGGELLVCEDLAGRFTIDDEWKHAKVKVLRR